MAKTQQSGAPAPDPDLLAAVVLHTLVSRAHEGMSTPQIAIACERDPSDATDRDEIETALEVLVEDGLAHREGELYGATRAALRASELSF